MKTPYKRISCDLYDQYEIYATYKTKVSIQYKDENEVIQKWEGIIKTLKTKDKAEYLITNDHQTIRLDTVIKIEKLASE